ncbi:hypothetical protein BH23CHL2_BH23CHL2_09240 [soil metagenome]
MKRTTVKIPDELDAWLRYEAKRRNVTISVLVREAIEQHLIKTPRRFHSQGVGWSGEGDLSVRVEEILDEEWGA